MKSDAVSSEWTNLRVCKKCWDKRNPQDFLKAVDDKQSVSFTHYTEPKFVDD